MAALTPVAKEVRPLVGSTVVKAVVATSTTAVGKVVRFSSDDTVVQADSGATNTAGGLIGIIVAGARHTADGSVAVGETVDVLVLGRVFIGHTVTLDFTKQYYLSTSGGMADAAGVASRLLALPIGNGKLFWNPVPTAS